jgi:hypothetical protein
LATSLSVTADFLSTIQIFEVISNVLSIVLCSIYDLSLS